MGGRALSPGSRVPPFLGRCPFRCLSQNLPHVLVLFFCLCLTESIFPDKALAIQLHQGSEGIIVHQVGHLFFLLSMVVLAFTITGKQLNKEKGWRMIQYSAILFILWNMDTIAAHFLDNQHQGILVENLPLWQVQISARSGSDLMVLFYHSLKLDHLLCVPALFFFYRGLSLLLRQGKSQENKDQKNRAGGP